MIELLVVISLISVLISILLPALKTARESGMRVAGTTLDACRLLVGEDEKNIRLGAAMPR